MQSLHQSVREGCILAWFYTRGSPYCCCWRQDYCFREQKWITICYHFYSMKIRYTRCYSHVSGFNVRHIVFKLPSQNDPVLISLLRHRSVWPWGHRLVAGRQAILAGITNLTGFSQATFRLMVKFLERAPTAPFQISAYVPVILTIYPMTQSPQPIV